MIRIVVHTPLGTFYSLPNYDNDVEFVTTYYRKNIEAMNSMSIETLNGQIVFPRGILQNSVIEIENTDD